MTALQSWAELEAQVNGRSFVGMTGVRDPEFPCDHFSSDYVKGEPRPFDGSCMTDGHYLCPECPHMSRSNAIERGYLPADDEERRLEVVP
jgi:hypothetical protein